MTCFWFLEWTFRSDASEPVRSQLHLNNYFPNNSRLYLKDEEVYKKEKIASQQVKIFAAWLPNSSFNS